MKIIEKIVTYNNDVKREIMKRIKPLLKVSLQN